jgi:hypothetical protein
MSGSSLAPSRGSLRLASERSSEHLATERGINGSASSMSSTSSYSPSRKRVSGAASSYVAMGKEAAL